MVNPSLKHYRNAHFINDGSQVAMIGKASKRARVIASNANITPVPRKTSV